MTDRRNRLVLALLGSLLFAGADLSVALGEGAFGKSRSHRNVFDSTIVRWWNEGGWMSYAVVVAIGVILLAGGLWMGLSQLRRNDGRRHTPTITVTSPGESRGTTTLRAAAMSHTLESDIERLPDVHKALVGLFGQHPSIELRALLEIGDDTNLDNLSHEIEAAIDRLSTTANVRLDPVQITLRYVNATRERKLA